MRGQSRVCVCGVVYRQWWLRALASGVRLPGFDPHSDFVSCVSQGKCLNPPVFQFNFLACQLG